MLKKLRTENNYTQKEIAKYLDMSKNGYASWEQGLAEPSINDIKQLCKLYKVSADYFIELSDEWGNNIEQSNKAAR